MKNPDGKERHLLSMIAAQERKIEVCLERIADIQKELEAHRANPVKMIVVKTRQEPIDLTGYCGKILYTSSKAARAAMKLINRDLRKKGKDPLQRAYHCKECDAWHLTTIPSWLPHPEVGGHAFAEA